MNYYLQHGEEFDVPLECAYDCSRPEQDATEAVDCWIKKHNFVWPDKESMLYEIKESGGWCDEDLSTWSEDTIQQRFLWLAACSFL